MSSEVNDASNPEPPETAASSEGATEPASPEESRFTRLLARGLAVGGLLLIVFHFTVTIIYINPISVVGLAWRQGVVEYLEPLFRQRWSLFAPDPPMLDRKLDYQCELDGEQSEWVSRSDDLLANHARTRFGPASALRRLETAAIVSTVGSQDDVLIELVRSQDQANEEQRAQVEDLLAQRAAAGIRSSRVAYQLVWHYCRQDLGRDPERMRYRIVTSNITPYSLRNDESHVEEPTAVTLPWLAPAELELLEQRALEYLEAYEKQKQERAQGEGPTAVETNSSPAEGGHNG